MTTMTEPKRRPKGPGGRPRAAKPKKNVIGIRGSEEWRDWVYRLADHVRRKSTDVIDEALIDFAKKVGFDEPAPKR